MGVSNLSAGLREWRCSRKDLGLEQPNSYKKILVPQFKLQLSPPPWQVPSLQRRLMAKVCTNAMAMPTLMTGSAVMPCCGQDREGLAYVPSHLSCGRGAEEAAMLEHNLTVCSLNMRQSTYKTSQVSSVHINTVGQGTSSSIPGINTHCQSLLNCYGFLRYPKLPAQQCTHTAH